MPLNRAVLPGLAVAWALILVGCTPGTLNRNEADSSPAMDRAVASAAVLAGYLEMVQRLVQSPPAQQAEILVATQREFESTPTPGHQLRYALALAAPGHTATDLPYAQRLLRELLASPERLLPAERALAFLELLKIDQQLTLEFENRKLHDTAVRDDQERLNALNRRLQTQIDENAQLRKQLNEARAKLDAIANIERSLSERKTNAEGRNLDPTR